MRISAALLLVLIGCGEGTPVVVTGGTPGENGLKGDPGPAGAMGAPGETGPAGPAGYSSGMRIRVRFANTSDGGRMVLGFRDELFDTDCYAQKATDGVRRCMPAAPAITGGYYSDSACSEPLVRMQTACPDPPLPKFAYDPTGVCGFDADGIAVRRVTGRYQGSIFVPDGMGGCMLASNVDSIALAVGPVIEASMFAEVTETVE